MNILLVEDDADIAANIGLYFEQKGHRLDFAYNGNLGLKLALENRFDLLILDLMLPGIDGISLCQQFRDNAKNYAPVLMLTARDTLQDKEQGFNAGADDYLVKPFSLRELELRVNALLRRREVDTGGALSYAGLRVDTRTREVSRDGTRIELKPKPFSILEYLVRHSDEVVSRQRLIEHLWPDDPPEGDPLRVHIHNLRQLVDQPFSQPLIHTIRGVGYRLGTETTP